MKKCELCLKENIPDEYPDNFCGECIPKLEEIGFKAVELGFAKENGAEEYLLREEKPRLKEFLKKNFPGFDFAKHWQEVLDCMGYEP